MNFKELEGKTIEAINRDKAPSILSIYTEEGSKFELTTNYDREFIFKEINDE